MTTPAKTTPATKAPARRKPADRMTKADLLATEAEAITGELPEGAEGILKPVELLRSYEQSEANATLIELFAEMGIDLTADEETQAAAADEGIEVTPEVVRAMGRVSQVLEKYALDPDRFAEFDTGKGAIQRMSKLAMWYLAELGE